MKKKLQNRISDLSVTFPDVIDHNNPITIYISCILDNTIKIANLPAEIHKQKLVILYPGCILEDGVTTYLCTLVDMKLKDNLVRQILIKFAEKINPGVEFELKLWNDGEKA
jgi:hypothetical protein